jgi:predicted transcriptional regulator
MNEPEEVASDEAKHLHILEGLDDVTAGRTVPHAEVKAWAKSLKPRTHEEPNLDNDGS